MFREKELSLIYLPLQLSVCEELKKQNIPKIFCSEQCTGYHHERKLTYEMCAPPKKEIISKVKKYLKKLQTNTKRLFIGTDNDSMVNEFKKAFKNMKVRVNLISPKFSRPECSLADTWSLNILIRKQTKDGKLFPIDFIFDCTFQP